MKAMKSIVRMLAIVAVGGLVAQCGASAGKMSEDGTTPPDPDQPDEERLIEESDLYKLVGDWLYVQNPTSGLNIIDVSNPDEPLLHRQMSDVRGNAGELYVRDDRVYVLFDGQRGRCTLQSDMEATWADAPERSEVVLVVDAPRDPKQAGRYCLPGSMVASRTVGEILYMITTSYSTSTYSFKTWLFSINVSDPENPGMIDFRFLTGESREVHVTTEAIFIAQAMGGDTLVQYMDISDPDGVMEERGDLLVTGQPQGRFHMDAWEDTFRIVTFSGIWAGTNLHVIDISDPDYLWLMSSYEGLAPDEELWATRFVEDKAYIVTFERWEPTPSGGGRWVWGFDPLWVISLSDPYSPQLLGELHIPGWSNFLFPRGDQLVAVGRGDGGRRVAVSLFDVEDPTNPRELRRLEFGADEASSEANSDFRGVRIIEGEAFGHIPLITVPYTNNRWDGSTCTPEHHLQLVDLQDDDLKLRGDWKPPASQQGLIRRTVPVGYNVYVISDRGVSALDVSNRSDPYPRVAIDMAGASFVDECTRLDFEIEPDRGDDFFSFFPFGCSISGPGPERASALPLLLAAMLMLLALRRRP